MNRKTEINYIRYDKLKVMTSFMLMLLTVFLSIPIDCLNVKWLQQFP